jgi:hypothetical protein
MTALAITIYLAVALAFLARSRSRGLLADALFAALWPYYLIRYWRTGR